MFTAIARHFAVARQAFRDEKKAAREGAAAPKARRREMAFMPAALEIMETPASPLGRALAAVIAVFFTIAIVWSVYGKMDIIATAQGKIIPSQRVKLIQPRDAGVIRAIHVKEGQAVRQGDVLVEMDPTDSEADRDRLGAELMAAEIEVVRMDALLQENPLKAFSPPDGAPEALVERHRGYLLSQFQEHQARRDSLDGEVDKRRTEAKTIASEIARINSLLPKVRGRVESRRPLVEKGILSRLSFSELEEELIDLEGKLEIEHSRHEQADAAMRAAVSQRRHMDSEFRRDIHAKLNEAEQRAASLGQEYIKARENSRRQTLSAPVDGVVQQLAVHTVGGVVMPAQELMIIVPKDARLEIEAMVQNKDIGFVHAKQAAALKVESFPFTKYGVIDGQVLAISADAVQDEKLGLVYPARVEMAKTTMPVGDKHVNLTPGMAVTVEIKTGKRRLIEYLLAPLQEYRDESLKER